MISGITLIDYNKRYSLEEYFKKRITKTVLPFLFWSLMGLVYKILMHQLNPGTLSVRAVLNGILNTSYVSIFWFFIPLFICYLSIPVFSAIQDKEKIFPYVLTITIICNSLIPFLINVFHMKIHWNLNFSLGGGYILYILLGYLLDKIHFTKKQQAVIYSLAIAGLLMHILGTYHLSMNAGKIISTYKGYLNIPCLLYSVGMYVLIKEKVQFLPTKLKGVIQYLKSYSFALYLLQFFFLIGLPKLFHINVLSLGWRLGGIVLILPLIIIATKIIRLLPFGKYVLP